MSQPVDSPPQTRTLTGQSVSPGVAFGTVHLSLESFEEVGTRRLTDSEVDGELARMDSVARAARVSLVHQRNQLGEHFTEAQRRIFDTHLKMLEDPTIEADLRSRITEDRLGFESALKDMLEVYERLFEVVESEGLRNKLSDMRDIALRLLRFAKPAAERSAENDREGGILVVRELSLSDLTEALDNGIVGIVAEHGSLNSHGSILTRAAGIPAVIGVGDLDGLLSGGTEVLLDGDNGQLQIAPSPEAVRVAKGRSSEEGEQELGPAALADGAPVTLEATAASPSEAKQVRRMGISRIGLFRTELPVMQRRGRPREDSLSVLYKQVVSATDSVTFRLPDLTSSSEIDALFPSDEPNPALGLRGVRLLLERPELLDLQLRAILRATAGGVARILVPYVVDRDEMNAVRSAAIRVREELRLEGVDVAHAPQVGVIFETPAAALLGRDLIQNSDFAMVGLDTLAEGLMMSDRRSFESRVVERLRHPHPVVLRAVRKLVQVAEGLDCEIGVYGESLVQNGLAQLLIGVNVRRFAVRASILRQAHSMLAEMDVDTCERVAEVACRTSTASELAASLPPSWLEN
ncbi:MAG: phosphoenolpyruvate-utilizing N-terminal domain-containing protein [Planctomycetota bacterium]|jgi:phosphotransferase system enzyme I (PtsI)|nr:phosphoenolpyruvate-utilizing N-terminal domain-containing protein [Planctomycetota bacterium]